MNVCGERIRALRESMNYSQIKFAQLLNLDNPALFATKRERHRRRSNCLFGLLTTLMFPSITSLAAPTIRKVSCTSTSRRTAILQTWLTSWKCASILNLP